MRKRKSTHKRGSKLPKDMLPVFKGAASPLIIPSMRNPSWNHEPNPMLDSLPVVEAEAVPRSPELEAEAPGPHVLEMETAEHASEMETSEHALELESQRPIAELQGTTRMSPLLQRTVRQEWQVYEETRLCSYSLRQEAKQSQQVWWPHFFTVLQVPLNRLVFRWRSRLRHYSLCIMFIRSLSLRSLARSVTSASSFSSDSYVSSAYKMFSCWNLIASSFCAGLRHPLET